MKKCSPRFQGWRLLEPLYVEEPKWIQINPETYESQFGQNEPFLVARGKRSLKLKILSPPPIHILDDSTSEDKSKSKKRDTSKENEKLEEKNINLKKNDLSNLKIIQKRSQSDDKKLLENFEKSLISRGGIEKSCSYLHPRNKHSDILEILEEPFFISRGKKNYPIRDFSMDDYFWEQYLNQHLDNFLSDLQGDAMSPDIDSSGREKILAKLFNDLRQKRTQEENRKYYESASKRNILDEINLQLDPFYIARG